MATLACAYLKQVSKPPSELESSIQVHAVADPRTVIADALPVVEQLTRLVAEYDVDAAQIASTLVERLKGTQFVPLMSEIEKQISGYNFEGAQKQLEALAVEIKQESKGE